MDYLSDLTRTVCNDFFQPFTRSTRASYQGTIKELSIVLGKDILIITKEECQLFLDHLNKKMTSGRLRRSTVVKKYKELSSFYAFVVSNADRYGVEGKVCNPFREIDMDAVKERIVFSDTVPLNSIDTILAYTKDQDMITYYSVLFACKYLLRTREFLHIKRRDFFYAGNILILEVVGDKRNIRYIRISKEMTGMIADYLERNEALNFFAKEDGSIYSSRTLQRRLKEACMECKLKPFTFNALRNTGIANAWNNDIPIKDLTDAIGMRTSRHIARIGSLKIPFVDAGNYVSIDVKSR